MQNETCPGSFQTWSARAACCATAAVVLLGATAAQSASGTLKGKLWIVSIATAQSPFTPPSATPDATFTTPSTLWNVWGPTTYNQNLFVDYTVGGWVASNGKVKDLKFSGQVNSVINQVVSDKTLLGDGVGYGGSNGTYGTFIELTGDVDLDSEENVSFSSSDGVSVNIDGQNVYQHSGPGSGSDSFFWTGTVGRHSVQMLFAECCGGGASFFFSPFPDQKPSR